MAGTPDLSKIIEAIMQNPELIATISSLMSKSEDNSPDVRAESVVAEDTPEPTESIPTAAPPVTGGGARSHRRELLGALKPYLSENRRAAIDSMISISDVLSMMRRQEG